MLHNIKDRQIDKMRNIIIIIFVLINFPIKAQDNSIFDTINKISWDCHITSLPTIIGSYETYTIKKRSFKHRYAEGRRNWKLHINYKKRKLFKIGSKESVIQGLDYYLRNRNNNSYTVNLNLIDKGILINKMKEKSYLNLTDSILNIYLNKDTLQIQFKEFNTEYSKVMDAITFVIDGAVFTVSLDLISNTDTTEYEYYGNIFDDVKDTQVNDFLLYYDLKNKYKIFANLRIKDYFSDENFYNVILRYIAYKEGTFERILTDEDRNIQKQKNEDLEKLLK